MPYKPYDSSKSPMSDFQWDDIQADVLATDISANSKISGLKQLKTETKIPTKAINALAEQLKNATTAASDAVERVSAVTGGVDLAQLMADVEALKAAVQTGGTSTEGSTGTSTGEQSQNDVNTRLATVERRLNTIAGGWHAPVDDEEEELPEGVNITPDEEGFVAYTGKYKITDFNYKNYSSIIIGQQEFSGELLTGLISTESMFAGHSTLTQISYLDRLNTSHVVNMKSMFASTKLSQFDTSSFNTSKVTTMASMFQGCMNASSVPSYDLNLSNFDTGNVTDMSNMFYGCGVRNLNISSFSSRMLTNVNQMFYNCYMSELTLGNKFTLKHIDSFEKLFYGCKNVYTLDLSYINAENVKSMNQMFYGCEKLNTLILGPHWNTSLVTDMNGMFMGCRSIVTLNLLNFNTHNINNMQSMFANCAALQNLTFGEEFNTSNVTNMNSLFYGCTSIDTIDISCFNTSNVTDMNCMFYGCTSLDTIVIGDNFDTSNVTSMKRMFYNCTSLPEEFPFVIDCSSIAEIDSSTSLTTNGTGISQMFYGSSVKHVKLKNVQEQLKSQITSQVLKGNDTLTIEFVN